MFPNFFKGVICKKDDIFYASALLLKDVIFIYYTNSHLLKNSLITSKSLGGFTKIFVQAIFPGKHHKRDNYPLHYKSFLCLAKP